MPALRLAAGTEVRSIHGGLATGVVTGTGAYAYLVESPVQYVRAVGGAGHPGAEHAIRGSVVSYVLSAVRPVVAECGDARTGVLVFTQSVVGEVVALDHIPGMGTGGLLEGRTHAKRPQAVLSAGIVVQGE